MLDLTKRYAVACNGNIVDSKEDEAQALRVLEERMEHGHSLAQIDEAAQYRAGIRGGTVEEHHALLKERVKQEHQEMSAQVHHRWSIIDQTNGEEIWPPPETPEDEEGANDSDSPEAIEDSDGPPHDVGDELDSDEDELQ